MRTLWYMVLAVLGLGLSSCGSGEKPAQGNGYPNGVKSEKEMKKVVILSSSPRRGGNSDLLCDRFMEGAISAGHQVEKLFLYDYEINDFVANDSLGDHTDRNMADDVPMIMDKLVGADVIVLATPVYFYTMCGRMKTMIDRTYGRHRDLKTRSFIISSPRRCAAPTGCNGQWKSSVDSSTACRIRRSAASSMAWEPTTREASPVCQSCRRRMRREEVFNRKSSYE